MPRTRPYRVLVFVSDTPKGAVGLRARALFGRVTGERFAARILYRERENLKALPLFLRDLKSFRPDLIYLHNIGWAAGLAALLARRGLGIPLIVETGDPLIEHFRSSGRSRMVCNAIGSAERVVLSIADEVVVRGSWLGEYFCRRGIDRTYHWIPDGVDLALFKPINNEDAKRAVAPGWRFIVGTVGRLAWNRVHRMVYGWDIIEAISTIPDEGVAAAIVGDGDGLTHLKRLAEERGVAKRVHFAGWVNHEQIPLYVNAMDVCVSTQTNDPVGWSRTTAKLPEYMACGRFILATDVGEAARLLKGTGQILPYRGFRDEEHPARLAQRIQELMAHPEYLEIGQRNREQAEQLFDYDLLASKLTEVLSRAIRE